jgi:double-strand break repair protein AddB
MTKRFKGVFGVAPGFDFATALKDGIDARLGADAAQTLARATIITNTRRAARRFEEVFAQDGNLLLPRIQVVTDLVEAPGAPVIAQDNMSMLARNLRVMRLVRKLLKTRPDLAPLSASYDLSESLCELVDELQGEGVPLDALASLTADALAGHWQTTLDFLKIIQPLWTADGARAPVGSEAFQAAVVDAMAAQWRTNPPRGPVIVAGSTGSRGGMRRLMQAVLTLDEGCVVLPGFDFYLNERSIEALSQDHASASDHPQVGFVNLARALETDIREITSWHDGAQQTSKRNEIISLALQPAPVTDEWLAARDEVAASAQDAMQHVSLMVSRTPHEEVQSIAIALRDAAEQGRRAVLITADGTLTRRVRTALSRWSIIPDESAGRPLRLAPPALFLDLVLQFSKDEDVLSFSSLLKSPICASGSDRGAHMALVRKLDRDFLRSIGPKLNWDRFSAWCAREECADWGAWLHRCFAKRPFENALLAGHLGRHVESAEALANGPKKNQPSELWQKAAGEALSNLVERIGETSEDAGEIAFDDYAMVLRNLLGTEQVRDEGYLAGKGIAIWGTLEARVQSADLVILGGLNEGSWPKSPAPDPWLSRELRSELGLASRDHFIALSAHDFQQAASNAEVIFSRSARDGSAPTVAARWLTRLENLFLGSGERSSSVWVQMQARGDHWLDLARRINLPDARVAPERRPSPSPPLKLRPKSLGVTDVEKLVRDPYAIYARKMLNLSPLEILGRAPDPRDRGIAVHKVMEKYIRETLQNGDFSDRAHFMRVARDVMDEQVHWPSIRTLWLSRLERALDAFLTNEVARRAIGTPREDWLEIKGHIEIATSAGPFQLVAKADRIDETADGGAALYDYKFSPPTQRQSEIFSKQLPLEAEMIRRGGFQALGARACVHAQHVVVGAPDNNDQEKWRPFTEIWDEFIDLLEKFNLADQGYTARLFPFREDSQGEYDHLARFGEWRDLDPADAEQIS